ncbi:MAG: hypothetical protein ACI9C4_001938 [Paraglaciecola sp.]|jgi:hypothetical protein
MNAKGGLLIIDSATALKSKKSLPVASLWVNAYSAHKFTDEYKPT